MTFVIPTTQELKDQFLTNLENKIGQNSPISDKAFLRVLSAVEAATVAGLYRLAVERALQNFALTATGDDLDIIGENYGVDRKPAESASFVADIDAAVDIPGNTYFIGDSNNERYYTSETVSPVGGTARITLIAETPGVSGNLIAGDTLTIQVPIVGAETVATIPDLSGDEILNLGVERETDEAYRRRVLNEIRTVGGGGNSTDYRTWAEETPGVEKAFPYSGAPLDNIPNWNDWNMEKTDVLDWTAFKSATLTKETTDPHGGLRCLRVTFNGTAAPGAAQTPPLTIGAVYNVSGYARSDGNREPVVICRTSPTGNTNLWVGTTATTWQYFDIDFVADDTRLILGSYCDSGGDYVEYDDVKLVKKSLPGDRTVFIEATEDIDPDGIAPDVLLDDAREYIMYDPVTGKIRPALGDINETLFVQSIYRTGFLVEIRNLEIDPAIEAETKDLIETSVDEYFRSVVPYIEGLDPVTTKNNVITNLTVSSIIQDILNTVGANVASIGFGIVANEYFPNYELGQGEMAKLESISYVST